MTKTKVDQESPRALIAFLRAQLDEDHRMATDAPPSPWTLDYDRHGDDQWVDVKASNDDAVIDTESGHNGPSLAGAEHLHRHEPRRALAAAKASLLLVNAFADALDNQANWSEVPEDTAKRVTLELACRAKAFEFQWAEEYRTEWTPDYLRAVEVS